MKSSEFNNLSLDDLSETKYNNRTNPHRIRLAASNFAVTIGIMALVTLLSFLFRHIDFHESNIIVAYILGVLLAAKQTDGYFYGILASVVGVLTFNFFFTEPYYTLVTYRPDYPVTFVIMLIAAIITSTLTAKAKQEARLSLLREKRARVLYQISKSLLKVRNINQIAEVGVTNIAKLFSRSVIISTINSSEALGEPYIYSFNNDERTNIFKSFNEMQVISETFKTGNPGGADTNTYVNSSAYYIPIKGQSGTLGVVGVSCFDNKLLSDEQKALLETVTTQIALAVERERLSEKQQRSKMEVERERLRGNLLRAISHDLRTPLTGILGSTATILDNDDVLDKSVKIKLLQGVYEDASWLIHSVENILSITRIDEGRIEMKKNMEAVEEIVAEAVSRIKKLAANHTIKINIPDDLIMLPMDGTLIEQVLVNLLDNAIKYTPYGSTIEIKTQVSDEKVVFEVSDNGAGISEDNIPLIFNRFYSAATINDTGRRGTGLGLAICKSIITAHGGEISVFNNPSGGATFRFELPAKE
ncbi:two-component system sensor histidine kinase KdpD [Anaerobacterium chartisolvens]|uniref:histidine kinase n=1 Tax=Anaerobacterium chartisolvens TaxID=1297424 RepID=A0A369B1P0_9FIRM|nr:DUF4118 domain-containing protein [Anaerobacterium chartisolvens]RCX14346.1 two-component system sensor histidine kinase KdpD [Anaerobacterium chartisolvens]